MRKRIIRIITQYLLSEFYTTRSFKGPKNISFLLHSLSALDSTVNKQEWQSYLRHSVGKHAMQNESFATAQYLH
jgi:hypothetical protein